MQNFEKKFFNSKKKSKNSLSTILITGPRRSGKTSFLKSIVNHFSILSFFVSKLDCTIP
jgi:predicted AAA+ superfamily ATPase